MKKYENKKIRVMLTEAQSSKFCDDRATILSYAMRILGNRSEIKIAANEQQIAETEIYSYAYDALVYNYLAENTTCRLEDVLYRLHGGHRLPGRMASEVAAAMAFAKTELERNPNLLKSAADDLSKFGDAENKFRSAIANTDWRIEIIGDLPRQIGSCRMQQ